MSQKSAIKPGCVIGAIALVLILGAAALFIFFFAGFNRVKMEHASLEARMAEESIRLTQQEEPRGVSIPFNSLDQYSPTELPDPLPAEFYVALTQAKDITALARETFIEAANGKRVEWELRIENLKQNDAETITGYFSLPYQLTSEHGSSGSTITVIANFPTDTRNSLLRLRTGEWVPVGGTLQIDGRSPVTLINPTILVEAPK